MNDTEDRILEIIEVLDELLKDASVPKNVKTKLQNTVEILKEDAEPSIRINKALNELDEIADDTNLQSYTRTQIWNIVSLLEKL